MTKHEEHFFKSDTWPPGITVSLPPQPEPVKKAVRLGRLSVWLAGGGVVCWIAAMASLLAADIYTSGRINDIPALKFVYVVGIACELAGVWMGGASRSTRVGKVGLIVSAILTICMVAVTVVDHHQDSYGQWFWTTLNDDCGCDPGP